MFQSVLRDTIKLVLECSAVLHIIPDLEVDDIKDI